MELTAAGESFLLEAPKVLAQAKRAEERARAMARGEAGYLDVGYFGSSIYAFIPDALRRFKRGGPLMLSCHCTRRRKRTW